MTKLSHNDRAARIFDVFLEEPYLSVIQPARIFNRTGRGKNPRYEQQVAARPTQFNLSGYTEGINGSKLFLGLNFDEFGTLVGIANSVTHLLNPRPLIVFHP